MKIVARFMMVGVLALVLVSGSALAQDDGVYCNGLSDDDCQLLKDSTEAMQTLQSVSVPAWSLTLDMKAPDDSLRAVMSGSGAIVVPPAVSALMSDLPPANSPDYAIALLDQIDAEWIEQVLSEMLIRFAVDEMFMEPAGDTAPSSFEIIIKDDMLYAHTSSPTGADMWFGQPIDFAEIDQEELEAGLDEIRAALTDADMDALDDMTGFQEQLADLAARYVTTTRGEDQTVDGQTVAVFTTSFDMAGYLTDPELPGLILELLKSPAFADMDAEVQDINETQMKFALSTVAMIVTNTSITSERWIGVDDHYMRKVQTDVAIEFDTSLFDKSEADSTGIFSIIMTYAIEMADFNAVDPDSVIVPPTFEKWDAADNFLDGSPDMIRGQLELDEPVSGTFDGEDEKDVYGLELAAGDAIEISLEILDDTPVLELYGPDGFLVAEYDPYLDKVLEYTAEEAGTYLVVVAGYWTDWYTLTVSAAS